jgi:hypothetical protein
LSPAAAKGAQARVRILLADDGAFREETLGVPRDALAAYERLIDCLREDPAVLKQIYIDVDRLAAAWVVEDDG